MDILNILRRKTGAPESETLGTLLGNLVPRDLPASVSTLPRAYEHRSALSDLHDEARGTDRAASLRAGVDATTDLIERMEACARFSDADAALQAQGKDAARALEAAVKQREQCTATSRAAEAEAKASAERLALQLTARTNIASAHAEKIAAAELQLHQAIAIGDEAAELSAAGSLRLASAPSPELVELDMRISAVTKRHEQHTASASVAHQALRAAERAEFGARVELISIGFDRSVGDYAVALLELLRVLQAGSANGHGVLAQATGLYGNHTVYVRDRSRVWFAPLDSLRKDGNVSIVTAMSRLVRLIEKPLDVDALHADLRHPSKVRALAA